MITINSSKCQDFYLLLVIQAAYTPNSIKATLAINWSLNWEFGDTNLTAMICWEGPPETIAQSHCVPFPLTTSKTRYLHYCDIHKSTSTFRPGNTNHKACYSDQMTLPKF